MISRLDHLVLTVRDLGRTRGFYVFGLGFAEETFGDGRSALLFGDQKLNLHEAAGKPILPRAGQPTPGSADFCLIIDRPLDQVISLLKARGIAISLGPVERTGAKGTIRSIYLQDPDENLVELSEYL